MTERRWTAADFDYHLPTTLIAQHPVAERGTSRLLWVEPGAAGQSRRFRDLIFSELAEMIPPRDLLVVNSTRVRHARFRGSRPSGGPAEVLLIHPATDDSWIAMGTPGSALRPGKRIELSDGIAVETLEVLDSGMRRVRFVGATAAEAIARLGLLPLPPYIDREADASDESRYQTVYAAREGSVAAPTAGLHFTPELLQRLTDRGVARGELDLEVGPGTFRPMEAGDVTTHEMHEERFEIPEALAAAITDCRQRGGEVWAVGTTVVRALESAAQSGGTVTPGAADTRLLITPGFKFQVVDRLITNFHLPKSTLLMLVAAFAGYDVTMAAYAHAVALQYRFYSYGDAMCLQRGTSP